MAEDEIKIPAAAAHSTQRRLVPELTTWHYLIGTALLLSPILGFVISSIGIVLATVTTPSGRQRWFGKLVMALVLLVPARIAGFCMACGWGYARGYQEAVEATARGDEHRFYQISQSGKWCTFNDALDVRRAAFKARQDGSFAGLPKHALGPSAAIRELVRKGCLVSTGLLDKCHYAAVADPNVDPQFERGSLFESKYLAVVFEGDMLDESDLRHLQGIAPRIEKLDYLEINAPRVTLVGTKSPLRTKVMRVSRSNDDQAAFRHLSNESFADYLLRPKTDDRIDPFQLKMSLEAARQRRTEWNARQQDGDSRTEASK